MLPPLPPPRAVPPGHLPPLRRVCAPSSTAKAALAPCRPYSLSSLLLVVWRPRLLADTFSSWKLKAESGLKGSRQCRETRPGSGSQHASLPNGPSYSNCPAYPTSATVEVRRNHITVSSGGLGVSNCITLRGISQPGWYGEVGKEL